MGPRTFCDICRSGDHRTRVCPKLPSLRGGEVEAPVAGYRAWKVSRRGGTVRLVSPYKDMPWNLGVPTTAVCDLQRARGHGKAPALRCTCGLYALHTFGEAVAYSKDAADVVGAVLGWGRVYLHREGWRAQHGQPLCLARTGGAAGPELAAELGLPLVPPESIEAYALEFGIAAAPVYARIGGPDIPKPWI